MREILKKAVKLKDTLGLKVQGIYNRSLEIWR